MLGTEVLYALPEEIQSQNIVISYHVISAYIPGKFVSLIKKNMIYDTLRSSRSVRKNDQTVFSTLFTT